MKLIQIIQKIFEAEKLLFNFTANMGGTFVTPPNSDGMFAMLMPCYNTEQDSIRKIL